MLLRMVNDVSGQCQSVNESMGCLSVYLMLHTSVAIDAVRGQKPTPNRATQKAILACISFSVYSGTDRKTKLPFWLESIARCDHPDLCRYIYHFYFFFLIARLSARRSRALFFTLDHVAQIFYGESFIIKNRFEMNLFRNHYCVDSRRCFVSLLH